MKIAPAKDGHGVALTVRHTSLLDKKDAHPKVEEFDHVICTVPLSILRQINLDECKLGYHKRTAMRIMNYDHSTKVHLPAFSLTLPFHLAPICLTLIPGSYGFQDEVVAETREPHLWRPVLNRSLHQDRRVSFARDPRRCSPWYPAGMLSPSFFLFLSSFLLSVSLAYSTFSFYRFHIRGLKMQAAWRQSAFVRTSPRGVSKTSQPCTTYHCRR